MVGSSSISTSPALTRWPSRTRMARTTPVSKGWMTFVRPDGIIFPDAEPTMSIWLSEAQASARQNSAMIVPPIAPANGGTGVSTISKAAGRKASSSLPRKGGIRKKLVAASANFMDACLQSMERRVASTGVDQLVVGTILDQAAAIDSHDAVGPAHGRQTVCDNEDGTTFGD